MLDPAPTRNLLSFHLSLPHLFLCPSLFHLYVCVYVCICKGVWRKCLVLCVYKCTIYDLFYWKNKNKKMIKVGLAESEVDVRRFC